MFIFCVILPHNLITSYYIYLLINRLFIRCLKKNISPCCVGYFSSKCIVLDLGYFFVKNIFFRFLIGLKTKTLHKWQCF